MSRDDFTQKYCEKLLWLGQRGLAFDTDERPRGPFEAGAYALALPDKIRKLVADILNDASTVHAPLETPKPAPVNGALPVRQK